jgi:Holliday junction resolvase-like predicted endonuclease
MSGMDRGRLGEDRAVDRLRADGCEILGRNRRIAGVEIDVLARDPREDLVLVVEVKASGDGRPPERRVDAARRRRLARAAARLGERHRVAIEVAAVDLLVQGRDGVRRIRLDPADYAGLGAQRGR